MKKGENIVGSLLGIEGSHPLEGDLGNLDRLVDAGYRLIALQHFFDNALGGSLHGEGNHGLTDFGRAVVAEMAARNLILDLAHSSPQTARDVLAMTDIPLVVRHTGTYGHCATKRNFSDDLIRAITARGGVIGICYWSELSALTQALLEQGLSDDQIRKVMGRNMVRVLRERLRN